MYFWYVFLVGDYIMVNWKIGEEFNPAKQLRTLYFIYFVITIIFAVFIWHIPVLFFVPMWITLIISITLAVILLFVLYWIPNFLHHQHKLDTEAVEWRRGIWFKNTGIIPYIG